jgi:RimJ/RimL family protein N-acetyltransferase
MIRTATEQDVERIVELGEMLHRESPRWSRLSYSKERAGNMIRHLTTHEQGAVFVAERAGVVVGGIAGWVDRHWSSDDKVAQEVSFFMAPEARGSISATRLICALRAWAEAKGAVFLQAGTSTGLDPERTARLYERLGFTRCAIGLEVNYGS